MAFELNPFNETYIRIDSDNLGILQELSEYMTFKIPNAHYMPSYKAGFWDRKNSSVQS